MTAGSGNKKVQTGPVNAFISPRHTAARGRCCVCACSGVSVCPSNTRLLKDRDTSFTLANTALVPVFSKNGSRGLPPGCVPLLAEHPGSSGTALLPELVRDEGSAAREEKAKGPFSSGPTELRRARSQSENLLCSVAVGNCSAVQDEVVTWQEEGRAKAKSVCNSLGLHLPDQSE